jgi:hypothetical protein
MQKIFEKTGRQDAAGLILLGPFGSTNDKKYGENTGDSYNPVCP